MKFPGFLLCLLASTPALGAEHLYVIKNPRHPVSGFYFHADSPVNGVCKVMGFELGVEGSGKKESKSNESSLQVDEYGRIVEAKRNTYVNVFTDVACSRFVGNGLPETSFLVEKPAHPQSQIGFSASANADGVCRALGYHKAVSGSIKNGSYGKGLEVNEEGYVLGYGSSSYLIESLVCLLSAGRQR